MSPRAQRGRSKPALQSPLQRVTLYGQELAYRDIPGRGPVTVLIHGIGAESTGWDPAIAGLAESGLHVVVLDLPGHGQSRGAGGAGGDYSLGALACCVRDLLEFLGHDRCLLVGHSLGGGIAMQFAYQFPERCLGLVLVASGGLGRETFPLLRAASLPGAELVLPLIAHPRTVAAVDFVSRTLSRVGLCPSFLSDDSLDTLSRLAEPAARTAFLATLREVVGVSGQRVSAREKLAGAPRIPTLLIWGDRDPIIPVAHAHSTLELLPEARLVIFPGAGHEPHRYDPQRFVDLVVEHARIVDSHRGELAG